MVQMARAVLSQALCVGESRECVAGMASTIFLMGSLQGGACVSTDLFRCSHNMSWIDIGIKDIPLTDDPSAHDKGARLIEPVAIVNLGSHDPGIFYASFPCDGIGAAGVDDN